MKATEEKLKRAEELNEQISDLNFFIRTMDHHDYQYHCFIRKKVEYIFFYKFRLSESTAKIDIPKVLVQKIESDAIQLREDLRNELDELFN